MHGCVEKATGPDTAHTTVGQYGIVDGDSRGKEREKAKESLDGGSARERRPLMSEDEARHDTTRHDRIRHDDSEAESNSRHGRTGLAISKYCMVMDVCSLASTVKRGAGFASRPQCAGLTSARQCTPGPLAILPAAQRLTESNAQRRPQPVVPAVPARLTAAHSGHG